MNIRKLRWWSSVRASLIATWCVVAVYASLAGFVQAQSAGEMKPVAVVALSGYDALIEDINFAGSMAGNPQMGGMLEGMIMMFTQGQGLVGFDKTKPIGIVVQSNGADTGGFACLPVSDLDGFLGVLQGLDHSGPVSSRRQPDFQDSE